MSVNEEKEELEILGTNLYDDGKYEEAIRCFDKAIKLEPNDAGPWASKASAQNNIGKYDDALNSVEEALRLNPNHMNALNNKAGILFTLGKNSEALSYFDKMIEIEPTFANAYNGKATVLVMSIDEARSYEEATKNYDEAIKCVDTAIKLEPSDLGYQENKNKILSVIETFEHIKRGDLMESDLDDNFAGFSWEKAEDLVGKLFEKKNYTVTVGVPTASGGIKRQGDFGIDVEAKNDQEYLGIQVKHWSNDIGFEDVAKTLGVAQKFNKVIIVSTKSGFTSQARAHAMDNPYLIELWDSNRFKEELRQHILK